MIMKLFFANNRQKVFFISAALIICLVLVFVYFQYSPSHKDRNEFPSPVGFNAEPDLYGWRQLFNAKTLEGWEITQFGAQGNIYVQDSSVILGFGDGCTGINWIEEFPTENYEIILEAKRISGNDFFCGLTFPVYSEYCTFIVGGWGGALVGISNIDGKDASENFTRTLINFESDRWYLINVKIKEDSLECFIDNHSVISVNIKDHQFSLRSPTEMSKPLGICSWMTTAAIRNIKFRII